METRRKQSLEFQVTPLYDFQNAPAKDQQKAKIKFAIKKNRVTFPKNLMTNMLKPSKNA